MDTVVSQPVAVDRLRKRVLTKTLTDKNILVPAIWESFKKLNPRAMWRNPVMFAVEIVAMLTTILFVRDIVIGAEGLGFSFQINLWLWFTVLFANFAEAVAEGRGKAQAASLRKTKTQAGAKLDRAGRLDALGAGVVAQAGRHRAGERGRAHPERRRRDPRRRLGE